MPLRWTPRLPAATWRDRLLTLALLVQAVAGLAAFGWAARYTWLVHRLTRGVGDVVFYGADGQPWFALEEQRREVPLSEISPWLQKAVVATEDKRFYHHPGIDPVGFARAVLHNLQARHVSEGGSTLTQQLARTLFLSNNRTLARKAKEAVIALMLEEQLTKAQILELYLNRVYFGGGAYGAEAMARRLYAKHAKDLSLPESALMAGLVQQPSGLSPWSNIDGALARSEVVLARMRTAGFISAAEERAADRTRLHITASPDLVDARSGYAKDWLRQLFRDRFGGDHPPDWEVHTGFLPAMQAAAERAVSEGLRAIGKPELQAALVAIDPDNGNVVALVGGRSYHDSPFNRAVKSERQPGSAFKPFVYAAALEKGYSPVTVLTGLHDVKVQAAAVEWTPRNAEDDTPDEATLREALLESNNQAAVLLQQKVGTGTVRDLAGKVGLADMPDVPSLALGTGVVTPLQLTAAFSVFPTGGFVVQPRGIVQVIDADGDVAFDDDQKPRRVLTDQVAFQALTMLQDVVNRGTASAARQMGIGFPAGGKTGTTSDFKDAWFVGFSSSLVVGVWVGYDQPASIGPQAFGARVALPIWSDFMRRAAHQFPPKAFEPPGDLRPVELCRISYLRPLETCPTYVEYFKEGDEVPTRLCPVHSGSLKQELQRAVEGVLDKLGRKLKGIFH